MTTPRTTTTAHTVTCLPEGHQAERHYSITVQRRGPDSWAVLLDGSCLSRDGQWDYEPSPSDRAEWLSEHRFTEPEALKLAAHYAPLIEVNGRTAAQHLAWKAGQAATPLGRIADAVR